MIEQTLEFRTIYDEFQPRVLRYLTNLAGAHEAEDLTQAVFSKASQALTGFRGESSLATWIFRIATNVAIDGSRSPLTRESVAATADVAETITADCWGDETPAPADGQLIRLEMNACIRTIIDQLPGDYRTVLLLSEFEELTDQEIAASLGVSLNTVKIRLHRARTKLRAVLECSCTFYRDERSELACDRKEHE